MPNIFLRILAVFLVPCLVVEPAQAAAFGRSALPAAILTCRLTQEAIIAPISGAEFLARSSALHRRLSRAMGPLVDTHHLPLYLWRPFRQELARTLENDDISEEAFDRIVKAGLGVARVNESGRIEIDLDALPALLKVVNAGRTADSPLRRADLLRYLLAEETFHLLLRGRKPMLSRLETGLRNPALYSRAPGSPVTDFEALKQMFVNNYGLRFANTDLFVSELASVYYAEQREGHQGPYLLLNPEADPTSNENRWGLLRPVVGLLEAFIQAEFPALPRAQQLMQAVRATRMKGGSVAPDRQDEQEAIRQTLEKRGIPVDLAARFSAQIVMKFTPMESGDRQTWRVMAVLLKAEFDLLQDLGLSRIQIEKAFCKLSAIQVAALIEQYEAINPDVGRTVVMWSLGRFDPTAQASAYMQNYNLSLAEAKTLEPDQAPTIAIRAFVRADPVKAARRYVRNFRGIRHMVAKQDDQIASKIANTSFPAGRPLMTARTYLANYRNVVVEVNKTHPEIARQIAAYAFGATDPLALAGICLERYETVLKTLEPSSPEIARSIAAKTFASRHAEGRTLKFLRRYNKIVESMAGVDTKVARSIANQAFPLSGSMEVARTYLTSYNAVFDALRLTDPKIARVIASRTFNLPDAVTRAGDHLAAYHEVVDTLKAGTDPQVAKMIAGQTLHLPNHIQVATAYLARYNEIVEEISKTNPSIARTIAGSAFPAAGYMDQAVVFLANFKRVLDTYQSSHPNQARELALRSFDAANPLAKAQELLRSS